MFPFDKPPRQPVRGRLTCGKCEAYSRKLGRCIYGKVNPRTKKGTKAAMEWGGFSYICVENKWRNQVFRDLRH